MNSYEKILQRILAKSKLVPTVHECALCRDTGHVFTRDSKGTERMYACPCPRGEALPPMFFPSDKDKTKPVRLPVYGKKPAPPAPARPVGRDKATGERE
jgi:hypothetical protein